MAKNTVKRNYLEHEHVWAVTSLENQLLPARNKSTFVLSKNSIHHTFYETSKILQLSPFAECFLN